MPRASRAPGSGATTSSAFANGTNALWAVAVATLGRALLAAPIEKDELFLRASGPHSKTSTPRTGSSGPRRVRASGETARRRESSKVADLTAQELQVSRFVAQRLSNRDVAAQLFLSPAALLCLAGALLVEAHDEWQVAAERRHLSERSMALLTSKTTEVAKPERMTA